MSQAADSAGQPFAGREFRAHPFEGDDGRAPEALAEALSAWSRDATPAHLAAVVESLRGVRLLMPLLAEAGDIGYTAEGKKVEKTQELSIVSVAGPDGRAVAVAFADVASMATWRPEARPVPIEAEKVAAWALDEHMTTVVVNPGNTTQCVLRRGALVALLRGHAWQPPWEDPEVVDAICSCVTGEAEVLSVESGWNLGAGESPDLLVTVSLPPGLPEEVVREYQQSWAELWSGHPVINQRVEGIRLRLVAK